MARAYLENPEISDDLISSGICRDLYAGPTSKRKKTSHDSIPWTSARCNRLLRTINSRLVILRKLTYHSHPTKEYSGDQRKGHDDGPVIHHPDISESNLLAIIDSPARDDLDWIPRQDTKARLRTYGKKAQSAKTKPLDGQSRSSPKFKTPLVRRVLKSTFASSPQENTPPVAASAEPRFANRFQRARTLPIKPNTSSEEAHNNLLSAFDSLLLNTADREKQPTTGAPSLFGTCLRKGPDYIQHEQGLLDTDLRKSIDVCDEIYSELEALGTSHDGGWAGLRQLVRAHCIKLIQDAVKEGLIPARVVERLVDVCAERKAVAELQVLLHTLLVVPSNLHQKLSRYVRHCAAHSQTRSMSIQLRMLIHCGTLSPYDLTRVPMLWEELCVSLMRSTRQAPAFSLLEQYIIGILEKNPQKEPITSASAKMAYETMYNIASLLTTAAATSRSDTSNISGVQLFLQEAPHRLVALINLSLAHDRALCKDDHLGTVTQPFYFSSLLLTAVGTGLDERLASPSVDDLVDHLEVCHLDDKVFGPRFFCDIARCASHIDRETSEELMQDLLFGLVKLSKTISPRRSGYLKRLAMDSAFEYADYRNNRNSHRLAEEIEDLVCNSMETVTARTPASNRKYPARYRWEEGMCEWIAATPYAGTIPSADAAGDQGSELHDSAISMGFDEEKRDSSGCLGSENETNLVEALPRRAAICRITSESDPESNDDCDELALITPAAKKQKRVRVRDVPKPTRHILKQTSGNGRVGRSRRQVKPSADIGNSLDCNASDDELGF